MDAENSMFSSRNARPFEDTFRRKKVFAFLTIAATVFCICCFFGSISVRSFETTSYVDVSGQGENPEIVLQRLIGDEIENQRLSSHIDTAFKNARITNDGPRNIDLDSIRESLDFRIAKRETGGFRLTTAYLGDGTNIEKNLTDSIARSLSERLGSRDAILESIKLVDQQFEQVVDAVKVNSAELDRGLDDANQLIDKLNHELSDIHQTIESLRLSEEIRNSSEQELAQAGQVSDEFHALLGDLKTKLAEIEFAEEDWQFDEIRSSISQINSRLKQMDIAVRAEGESQAVRIINAALVETNPEVRSILDSLEALDVDTIQTKIGQLQNNSGVDANRLQQEVAELKSLSGGLTENQFIVGCLSKPKTRPAYDSPIRSKLILFGFLSMLIGLGVALFYQPALEGVGFSSVAETSKVLGVPVVSSFPAGQNADDESIRQPGANLIVRFSEVFLLGFVLLIAILCLIQPDIRSAFFENPVFGLSKFARLFF